MSTPARCQSSRVRTAKVCLLWRIPHKRHRFAVRTLVSWYRAGIDIEANLPLLSTYMGHIDPASTYWYLSAVPELLFFAAQRLERREQTRS